MCAWLLTFYLVHAQAPQLISYQAVARDLTGKVLSEKPISVQVEILQGSNQGTTVYTETHELTTTKTGTINLLIGGGNAQTGTFAEIDWSKSPYFLRLGMKQKKEAEYTDVSNTQMISVPYALYAEKAGSVENKDNDIPEFVFVADGYERTLADILNGKIEIGTSYNSEYGYLSFNWSLLYLRQTDLQLRVVVDGFPNDAIDESEEYSSSKLGHSGSISIGNIPQGTYQLNMRIINNEGVTEEEYPFTLVVKPSTN